jgi:Peptidase family M28
MKKSLFFLLIVISPALVCEAQTNITLSNPEAQQILLGNYNPATYTPTIIINHPDSILIGIVNDVSKDTLISYLLKIDSYHNRNTGSDTLSETRGIGAVRRWIHKKYNEYRAQCENRLVVTYMDFDVNVCGQNHHRNVLAILPGLDTTNKEIMVLEGHFDTRCEGVCDTACYSPGMEDNGSGTVLVMELARIMSRYAFDHTILFASVTGEDQGLYGSTALSIYLKSNNVKIRSVFNDDVIGGIICGQTSSPPSCPGLNAIDSTHVRIFSYSYANDTSWNSPHKQLARYIRLHQDERINPLLSTPMTIDIILYEDRIGRSGDHVPFRQRGYTSIRFCSKNEHGNGAGVPPDRQHSIRDILGLDTTVPPDGIIDSFFVDPNYLRRNIIMNGVNLGWLAIAPPSPSPEFTVSGDTVIISLHDADTVYRHYRVGIRSRHSGSLYFDTVYTFINTTQILISGLGPDKTRFLSVANVKNNVESLFSGEYALLAVGIGSHLMLDWGIMMHQNHPNPFSEQTEIIIEASDNVNIKDAALVITDFTGRTLRKIPVEISPGMNQLILRNEGLTSGMYTYSLRVSNKIIGVGKMSVY